jgi:hypothetical protein
MDKLPNWTYSAAAAVLIDPVTLDEAAKIINDHAPAPAVDWRQAAEKLYFALNQYKPQFSLWVVDNALSAYESALSAEAGSEKEEAK